MTEVAHTTTLPLNYTRHGNLSLLIREITHTMAVSSVPKTSMCDYVQSVPDATVYTLKCSVCFTKGITFTTECDPSVA